MPEERLQHQRQFTKTEAKQAETEVKEGETDTEMARLGRKMAGEKD